MKTCDTGKTMFTSERQAKRALRSIRSDTPGRMHPYRCRDHWHLGHSDLVEAKRAKMRDKR